MNKRCVHSYKMWWQNGKFGTVNWQASYCMSHIHITSCFISHICVLYTAQRPPPSDIHSRLGGQAVDPDAVYPVAPLCMECDAISFGSRPRLSNSSKICSYRTTLARYFLNLSYWLLPGNSCVSPSTNPKHNQKIAKARIGQISGIKMELHKCVEGLWASLSSDHFHLRICFLK